MGAEGALAVGNSKNLEPNSKEEEREEQKAAKEAKGEEAVRAVEGGDQADEQKETKETKEKGVISPAGPNALAEEFFGGKTEGVLRVEHPEGEVFFSGNAEEVADAEAEEVARGQLARSGLLRGQRVRVAE